MKKICCLIMILMGYQATFFAAQITRKFSDCEVATKDLLTNKDIVPNKIIVSARQSDVDVNLDKKWEHLNREPWGWFAPWYRSIGEWFGESYRKINNNDEYWGYFLYHDELPLVKIEWYLKYFNVDQKDLPKDVLEEVTRSREFVDALKKRYLSYADDLTGLFRQEEFLTGLAKHGETINKERLKKNFEEFTFITNRLNKKGEVGGKDEIAHISRKRELKVYFKKVQAELDVLKNSDWYQRVFKKYGKQFQRAIDHAEDYDMLRMYLWGIDDLIAEQEAETLALLDEAALEALKVERKVINDLVNFISKDGKILKPSPVAQYHFDLQKRMKERSLLFSSFTSEKFLKDKKNDELLNKLKSTKDYLTAFYKEGSYRKLLKLAQWGSAPTLLASFGIMLTGEDELEKQRKKCVNATPVDENFQEDGEDAFYLCATDYVRRNSTFKMMFATWWYDGDVEKINEFLEGTKGYKVDLESIYRAREKVVIDHFSRKRNEKRIKDHEAFLFDGTKYDIELETIESN